MKISQNYKKYLAMKDSELKKEVANLEGNILGARIEIANRKTKGIHRINNMKKNIARIKTVISRRLKEQNEK